MLQEKRLYPGTSIWEPGTINDHSFKVYGNLSSPETNSQDNPGNPWDGFRMAAVYSTAFANGPGARLFYHSQSSTGLPMVQELIWTQENDTWSNGFQFLDPWPNSDLSATIDDATQTLRLFYSSGNLTLEESWTSVADLGATYQPGMVPHDVDYDREGLTSLAQASKFPHFSPTTMPPSQPFLPAPTQWSTTMPPTVCFPSGSSPSSAPPAPTATRKRSPTLPPLPLWLNPPWSRAMGSSPSINPSGPWCPRPLSPSRVFPFSGPRKWQILEADTVRSRPPVGTRPIRGQRAVTGKAPGR